MPDENTAGRQWKVDENAKQQIQWGDVALPPINLHNIPKGLPGDISGLFNAPATGVKHDGDKPRMDLLDPEALEGLAKVLTFGSLKYSANNWRGGMPYGRLIAALLRHLFAIMRGEDNDPESGLPHVDHLGCCWMFLSWNMKNRKDLDDRYKPNPQ